MKLKIFRCGACGKMLFKFNVNGKVEIEIKCPRCDTVTKVKLVNSIKR